MGILDNIGKKGRSSRTNSMSASAAPSTKPKGAPTGSGRPGSGAAGTSPSAATPAGASKPGSKKSGSGTAGAGTTAGTASSKKPGKMGNRLPGKRRRSGSPSSPRERVQAAAAPLHDRRRRLVGARETTLRDLGGLMLEMYKRNRFREELLLDKCEEVLAIEVEIAHVDQRLFQLAPPNAAGMRPIGRCECGASIHPGQNFCGLCGRSFATLTQSRSCARCGSGLRPGDQFCATCGSDAPDALQAIEGPSMPGSAPDTLPIDAAAIASSAVADTVVIEPPPLIADAPPGATSDPLAATPSPAVPPAAPDVPVSAGSEPVPAPDSAAPATASAAPAPGPSPTPPSAPAPAGFDWTAPPAVADAAIDAAVDSMPASPTDPETPFAGFPLSSTVPPPPIVDPIDIRLPIEDAASTEGSPSVGASTPEVAQDSTSGSTGEATDPTMSEKAAAKAAKKAEAAAQKQRHKEAKARAKARAKGARAQRKRGGDV